jgi:hypothetical protein
VPYFIRSRFEEHRRELRKAIKRCLAPSSPGGEIPYLLTAKFIKFVEETAQMANLERVLRERGPDELTTQVGQSSPIGAWRNSVRECRDSGRSGNHPDNN